MRTKTLLGAAIAALVVAPAAHSMAQGIMMPDNMDLTRRPVHGPIFVQPFYVKNLRVSTVINDAVAATTVEQTFVNSGSFQGEATYLYPLPEGASPTGFSMTIGDKTMEPRILPKDEADRIYEGYVRRYRDPALLEYVGHSLVKASVFPIPPQGERVIRLTYTEVLKPENGIRRYVYPLSTSRFGAQPVGIASVSIKLMTSTPIKNVYSPTHELSVRHDEENRATASWEGDNQTSDKDLILYFSTGSDEVGMSLLSYKTGDKDGYFMLLASPKVSVPRDKILPKQIVFVLDRTGSMTGKKIEQARKSLLFCLNALTPADRFDVITFNESPDLLYKSLQPADADHISKAKQFVENIEAAGGTNIDEALHAAVGLVNHVPGDDRMIVFLTDGLPTVGETNIETILDHFKRWNTPSDVSELTRKPGLARTAAYRAGGPSDSARIFCFGLGYDVNVPFLDSLAKVGRGDSDYIKPQEDVEARVSSFFAKVSSPVLSHVALNFDGMSTYDVYPKELPDLFKGSQLVVTGRFHGGGAGTVQLTGTTGRLNASFSLAVHSPDAEGVNTFVPRIWAQRKLGYLIDQIRLSNNPAGNTEILDEIVRISKEYGIITEYTSFLVDEHEQDRLGLQRDARGDVTTLATNGAILRQEVAGRAVHNGISGEAVTDQSSRAKDFALSDKASSRYQSSNGSVGLQAGPSGPSGDLFGYAEAGNYRYLPAGGGLGGGGFTGVNGHTPIARRPGSKAAGTNDAGNAITVQNVAGRTFFRMADNVWQDQAYTAGKTELIKIEAFSDAHFALLRRIPDLGKYSSVGETVIVRLNNCAIEIGSTGKASLTEAELKRISEK